MLKLVKIKNIIKFIKPQSYPEFDFVEGFAVHGVNLSEK